MRSLGTWARWAEQHASTGLDLIRIYLGFALFVRGALFVQHPEIVLSYIRRSGDWFWPVLISHYVGMAHLGGGLLLLVGLFTRVASAVQLPALFGAVFFVHFGEGLLSRGQSLELAALVLLLLLVLTAFGSGPISVDAVLRRSVTDRGGATARPESRRPGRGLGDRLRGGSRA